MKISHRSHPILEKLHNGSLGAIPVNISDADAIKSIGAKFDSDWKLFNKEFKSDINIITNPFYEAVKKAKPKLIELLKDKLANSDENLNTNGCYVQGDLVYMISHQVENNDVQKEMVLYIFNKDGTPLALFIESAKYQMSRQWISNSILFIIENNPENFRKWIYQEFSTIICFNMFKKYAEVETKILLPNSKTKGILCKYVNQTKLKLTYLDSTWFTNLVKSSGFNVRGHFRLQPMKKNGEWTKELIWISEFEKTGYTAPARKIAAYA